mgnify:CR=1 FL=1|tara:strand:- start:441 stop:1388 length:948 start_codon:yes stop_codon:yes gene_type:complete
MIEVDVWPESKLNISDLFKRRISINQIEIFFKDLYKTEYILYFSSGRSSIVNILKSLDLKREDFISTGFFANSCIFRTVGHISTPTPSNFNKIFNCSLVYHQWGYPTKTSFKNLIIEDSVDSIIIDKKGLFLNNGSFEILSLSKLFGFFSGAIVIAKNKNLYEKLKKTRNENKFSNTNFFLSLLSKLNKNYYQIWGHSQTLGGLESQMMNLFMPRVNFNFNELIYDRKQKINILLPLVPSWLQFDNFRLPTLIPIEYNQKILQKLSNNNISLPIRHFNKGQVYENWNKIKVFCLPIHQGVSINKIREIFDIIYER